ncbi:MAG: metallophosphoesterase, partial [Deltaproteobacteria bacterium]|nr:metallophosphoesterase [Deltaproteobacteria bacterium]
LVNPGGVGQPRDGNPMAAFLVYDADERQIKFFRVEYDIAKCCEKVINAGLPRQLAQRLMIGR